MSGESGFARPTTVPDMVARFDHLISARGARAARDYHPSPGEIFIATPPKCGTTWMQQIVHGLRTGGSMDFDNINDVIPWLEMAYDVGQDLHADQGARPRAFKSHWTVDELPAGANYIVVVRDPRDALLSTYAFFDGAFFESGAIDLAAFAREFYIPAAEVPRHVLALWRRRRDPRILALTYESMKADPDTTVRRVARFIGVHADDELCDLVVQQSNLAFMKQHPDKFDDRVFFDSFRHAMRLPPTATLSKVRHGRAGAPPTAFPAGIIGELDAMWTSLVTPITGWHDYHDLERELANPQD